MRNLIRFSEGVNRKKGVMFWLVRNRKRQTKTLYVQKRKHSFLGEREKNQEQRRISQGESFAVAFYSSNQVRVSLTSIILIVNHLFLIGIEFGEN